MARPTKLVLPYAILEIKPRRQGEALLGPAGILRLGSPSVTAAARDHDVVLGHQEQDRQPELDPAEPALARDDVLVGKREVRVQIVRRSRRGRRAVGAR